MMMLCLKYANDADDADRYMFRLPMKLCFNFKYFATEDNRDVFVLVVVYETTVDTSYVAAPEYVVLSMYIYNWSVLIYFWSALHG